MPAGWGPLSGEAFGPAWLARRTDTPQPFATCKGGAPPPDRTDLRPVPTAAAHTSLWSAAMHTISVLNDLVLTAAAPAGGGPKSIAQVISNITGWVMGIIALVATMFLVIGGLRYMAAGGDPAQVEQAKGNVKSALIGYALAVLAPVILQVLQGILGG
ncbi:hypothetical protein Nm8I071_37370 [Nonomuraea sp. TT08I-71]|nr:hypothetical protein Nm8I071_37370 [Nonomuraea sp. TT08I-71]